MSAKETILKKLLENRGCYFSGEALAAELLISRAAVWKAISALKKQGHLIVGIQNKGYSILNNSNILAESEIRQYLKINISPIYIFDTINSTNIYAKQLIAENAPDKTLVIAETQTDGKGRFNRSFFCEKGNIYMSLILKDSFKLEVSTLLTISVAVAVVKALEEATGEPFLIKWVNDIYYKNKKLCGILTEGILNLETGLVDAVVIGIGINLNLNNDNIPADIKDTITSLNSFTILRNKLIADITNSIVAMQEDIYNSNIMDFYKSRSFLIGENIEYTNNGVPATALVIDITSTGALLVKNSNGEHQELLSAQVSLHR